jgi:ABC-type taurine transport system substrate-binding protein
LRLVVIRHRESGVQPESARGKIIVTSAILVPKDSAIKTVADLKGKKVAFNKGSNVHYLLVRALEKAGLKYSDIESVFLAPADARAAFERGSIHAWAIWDPFQAAAEAATGARTLADGSGIVANHQFYLAAEKFADGNPQVLDAGPAARGGRLGEAGHQGGRRASQPMLYRYRKIESDTAYAGDKGD